MNSRVLNVSLAVLAGLQLASPFAFSPKSSLHSHNRISPRLSPFITTSPNLQNSQQFISEFSTAVYSSDDDSNTNDSFGLGESEQTLLGVTGLIASIIMLYSESVLFQTGCGLPAGPFGLVGAAEGISYLGVVGLVGFALFKKVKTGSGLPSGPGGILGAAEGVAFLAVLAGILVLISQVTNFGYIPNAVPMEGGMCS